MRKSRWFQFIIPLILYFGSRVFFDRILTEETVQPSAPISSQPANPQEDIAFSPEPIPQPSTEVIEGQIHQKINEYRASQGLAPLAIDYRITNESRLYSAKMASGAATFSHDGFEQRAASLEKQALKYESVAENLALLQGYDDLATVAVQGWIDSPGHHKNIVGDFDLTGIGVVKNAEDEYYFTQLFLKRR